MVTAAEHTLKYLHLGTYYIGPPVGVALANLQDHSAIAGFHIGELVAIAVGDVFRLVVVTRCRNQNGLMVFYAKVTAKTGADTQVLDVANVVSDGISQIIKGAMSELAFFQGVQASRIFPVATDTQLGETGAGEGTVAGDCISTQTSGLVKMTTGLAGRANRGRKYVPFPGETDNTVQAKPSDGYLNKLTLLGAFLLDPLVVNNVAEDGTVTVEFGLKKTGGSNVLKFTGFNARREWATQRRRSQINRADTPIT